MADQAINALSTKTAPETSDQLLLVGTGEPQLIDYDKLADAILNKITSKNYALDAGQMTLLAALNKLNSESKSFVSLKESIKYSGDDSAFNIVSSDSTIYYRAVALNVAHPVLLGSGGILIGYCFNRNYQRQIYYSSQIIATRTCYGGTWNSWERIK